MEKGAFGSGFEGCVRVLVGKEEGLGREIGGVKGFGIKPNKRR